jgi:hypothetical protein
MLCGASAMTVSMTVWMAWETGGKKKTDRATTAARVNVVLTAFRVIAA